MRINTATARHSINWYTFTEAQMGLKYLSKKSKRHNKLQIAGKDFYFRLLAILLKGSTYKG